MKRGNLYYFPAISYGNLIKFSQYVNIDWLFNRSCLGILISSVNFGKKPIKCEFSYEGRLFMDSGGFEFTRGVDIQKIYGELVKNIKKEEPDLYFGLDLPVEIREKTETGFKGNKLRKVDKRTFRQYANLSAKYTKKIIQRFDEERMVYPLHGDVFEEIDYWVKVAKDYDIPLNKVAIAVTASVANTTALVNQYVYILNNLPDIELIHVLGLAYPFMRFLSAKIAKKYNIPISYDSSTYSFGMRARIVHALNGQIYMLPCKEPTSQRPIIDKMITCECDICRMFSLSGKKPEEIPSPLIAMHNLLIEYRQNISGNIPLDEIEREKVYEIIERIENERYVLSSKKRSKGVSQKVLEVF